MEAARLDLPRIHVLDFVTTTIEIERRKGEGGVRSERERELEELK